MHFKIPRIKRPVLHLTGLLLIVSLLTPLTVFGAEAPGSRDRSLFWAIQKQGEIAGYLLGTIHSEDPRVLDFSPGLLEQLQSSDIYAMELVPDIPTLARLSEYMHYPEDQRLEQVIGAKRFNALSSAMSTYEIPADFVNSMKPWAAMMTLSTPPPVTGFFMDLSLSLRASGSGVKVIGLETLEQQLSFLEDMPMDMQISLLDQAIEEFGKVQRVHDEMVEYYLDGDLQQLYALSLEQLNEVGEAESEYFVERGIDQRNQQMLDTLLKQLPDKRVFVAVGALHLPGPKGLINLLRQQGFKLSPLSGIVVKAGTEEAN